jgi:predicted DNA-binding antitoxin AbrB/MazE fold protein
MAQIVDAIYEKGLLRPLDAIHLNEHEKVRIIIECLSNASSTKNETEVADDPLCGFRFSLGIPDFSNKFNHSP